MATLQRLSNRQIDEVVRAAAQRRSPATLTLRAERGWTNIRSRIVDLRDGRVRLELVQPSAEESDHDFQLAEKVGVSFKLKHHKHVFTGTVASVDEDRSQDGTALRVVWVCSPTRMHRMQRRAFIRVEVPANRVVRASFWMGGRECEPAGTTRVRPVWFGRITDISAGGFLLWTEDLSAGSFDMGETVGTRISFGTAEEAVYADAQFRHVQDLDGGICVGFQFVGLAQSIEGRRTLQLIGEKAAQFQRECHALHRTG